MTRNNSSPTAAAEAALAKPRSCCFDLVPRRRSERIWQFKAEDAAPTKNSSKTLSTAKAVKAKAKSKYKSKKKKARKKPRRKPSSRVANTERDPVPEVVRSLVLPIIGNAASPIQAPPPPPNMSTPSAPPSKKKTPMAFQQLLCQEETPPKMAATTKTAAMTLLTDQSTLEPMTNDNSSILRCSFEKTRSIAAASQPNYRVSPLTIPSQPVFCSSSGCGSSSKKNKYYYDRSNDRSAGIGIHNWSRGPYNETPLSPSPPSLTRVAVIPSPVRLHKIRRPDGENESVEREVLHFLGTVLESPHKSTPPTTLYPCPDKNEKVVEQEVLDFLGTVLESPHKPTPPTYRCPCSSYESVVRSQGMLEAAKNLLMDMEVLDDIDIDENYEQEGDATKDDVGVVLRSWAHGLYQEKTVHE